LPSTPLLPSTPRAQSTPRLLSMPYRRPKRSGNARTENPGRRSEEPRRGNKSALIRLSGLRGGRRITDLLPGPRQRLVRTKTIIAVDEYPLELGGIGALRRAKVTRGPIASSR